MRATEAPRLKATLRAPMGVAYRRHSGDILISDTQNNAIPGCDRPATMDRIITLVGQLRFVPVSACLGLPETADQIHQSIGELTRRSRRVQQCALHRRHEQSPHSQDRPHIFRHHHRCRHRQARLSRRRRKATAAGAQVSRRVSPSTRSATCTSPIRTTKSSASSIRRGIISTFAGAPVTSSVDFGDGGFAANAEIGAPADVFADKSGTVYIVDEFFSRIRAVLVDPQSFSLFDDESCLHTAATGSLSQDQRVDVTGTITGIPYTISSSAPWLQASPAVGNMPSSLKVTIDPSALSPGSYQGTLTVQAPTANPPGASISVSLTVTAAGQPTLSVKPSALTAYSVVNASPLTRVLTVSNTGGGTIPFRVSASAPWLTLSSSTGSVGPFASTSLTATLNPAKLGAGIYFGAITIASTSSAQSISVPVTMTVTQVEQSILIPQSGLTFYVVEGGGAPPPQVFSILNTGRGQMPFTTKASTLTGGQTWLIASPSAGSTSSTLPLQGRVDIDPTGLKAGVYYGTVAVSAPTAVNTPQIVSVVLNVLPPGNTLGPILTPTGMIFVAPVGGESPASQALTIQSTSSSPVTFRSVPTTTGGNWLTVLPPGGVITQAQTSRVVVQPNITGLPVGVYRGSITFSFSDGSIRTVTLALVITPGTNSPKAREAGCGPTTLVPIFTSLPSGYSASVGYPSQVGVKVLDDCGTPMTTGGVAASFSNGDDPLPLISLLDGNWVSTWTPAHASAVITVTADASIPEQNLKGEIKQTTSSQANDATPIVGNGGILNGASFALQAPLAPGSFVSVFGGKLASGPASAPNVPLPTTLGGGTVYVGGQEIPVYYASDGQLNAILPYGLQVNTTQQVFVAHGSGLSVPQAITLAAAAPGVFTVDGTGKGQGIIVNGIKIVDATNPAKAGDTVVIYATGLGEVSPQVQAGTLTPITGLSQITNPITVTIGGVQAQSVSFAGLTPGQVGLYQINVVVPPGIPPGKAEVVVTVAGSSSAPVTMALK